MKKKILFIRILLWGGLFSFVFFLFWQGIVPTGKIIYSRDYSDSNFFISDFTPKERFEKIEGTRLVNGNPIYFSLFTPRIFDKATLNIKYKNIEDVSEDERQNRVIEAGILVDGKNWRHELKPIENKIIDQLSLVWDNIKEGDLVFLQREKKYNSISDFLKNLPNHDEFAVYNYDLKTDFIINDYSITSEENTINHAIRGSYQFYTYIKDEVLDFEFDILDINKNKDSDSVDIFLYYENQMIATRHLDDDGIIEDKNETKNNRTINLLEENLPEGVYKIELKSNDDIITKQIKTKQNKLSFINKLWLYKSNKENINLFTDSKVLHAKTVYPTSLQNIQINTEELKIEETYTQFSTNIKKASNTKYTIIEIEHDGIVLACDEVFSFTENSMINPRMKKVGNNIDINNEGINYVLAKYKSPKKKDDWKIVEIEFDLTKAYREDGKYNFLISAPSFKLDDKLKNGILIDEISINLESVKLIDKIRKKFSNQ